MSRPTSVPVVCAQRYIGTENREDLEDRIVRASGHVFYRMTNPLAGAGRKTDRGLHAQISLTMRSLHPTEPGDQRKSRSRASSAMISSDNTALTNDGLW